MTSNDKHIFQPPWLLPLLVAAIVLLGLALRLADLGTESYWQDEVSMLTVLNGGLDQIITEMRQGGRPPLYVLLAYGWSQLAGTGEAEMRLLSALLSTGVILAVYLLTRELFDDPRIALLAAFIVAIAGRHIYHAQNVRYYALQLLLAALSCYYLMKALRVGRWWQWLAYMLLAVGVVYTHTHGIFLILAQGVFGLSQWFVYKGQRWRWVGSQFVIALLVLPQMLPILVDALPGVFGIFRPFVPQVADAAGMSLGGLGLDWLVLPTPNEFLVDGWRLLFYGISWAGFALSVVFLCGALALIIRRRGWANWWGSVRAWPLMTWRFVRDYHSPLLLIALVFAVVWIVPWLGSFFLVPMYVLRYVIVASLGLAVLLAVAIYSTRQIVPIWVSVVALSILMGPTLYSDYYVGVTKEEWRGAAAFVATHSTPGEVIVMPTWDRFTATVDVSFAWYYDGELPLCPVKIQRVDELATRAAYTACTADADALWLVLFEGRDFVTNLEQMTLFLEATGYVPDEPRVQLHQVEVVRFVLSGAG